ncbi:uncharacterized protein LOC126837182 [Adelges cooleyi]|uniref:uncharacterized protein LOC126837182 n=1 Tax=Adelges cooleyi TaxID=133065 RepID=UPI002180206A|nr:uncharacterized protein LOC126837182 [Adelges cooleyi]
MKYLKDTTLNRLSHNGYVITTSYTDKRIKKKKSLAQRKKGRLRRREQKKLKKLSEKMNRENNCPHSAPDDRPPVRGINDHVENMLENGNHTQPGISSTVSGQAPNGRDSDSESESNDLQQQVPISTVDDNPKEKDQNDGPPPEMDRDQYLEMQYLEYLESLQAIPPASDDGSDKDKDLPPANTDQEFNGVSSTVPMGAVQPPSSPPPPPPPPPPPRPRPIPRRKKKKKRVYGYCTKIAFLRRKLIDTVLEYSDLLFKKIPITDQLALLLTEGDLLYNIYQCWDTREASEVRDLLRQLIYSLNNYPENIVPFIGCLTTLFRQTCPTVGLTPTETYVQFQIFFDAIKECVREVNVQFYRTWMTSENFLVACIIIDSKLIQYAPGYTHMSWDIKWNKKTAFEWYINIPTYSLPEPIEQCDDIMDKTSPMTTNRLLSDDKSGQSGNSSTVSVQAPDGRDSDSESESNDLQQQVPISTVDDNPKEKDQNDGPPPEMDRDQYLEMQYLEFLESLQAIPPASDDGTDKDKDLPPANTDQEFNGVSSTVPMVAVYTDEYLKNVESFQTFSPATSTSISDFSDDEFGEQRSCCSASEYQPPANTNVEFNGVSSTVQPPSSLLPSIPRPTKKKKRIYNSESKVLLLQRKLKAVMRQYTHVYVANPIIEQLALLLKAGDMLYKIYQCWDTRLATDIRDHVRWLIYSLNNLPENIVPFIGCLMTLFRSTCPTSGLSAAGTYIQFQIFIDAIEECVRAVNVQFYRTWMTPESFLFACCFIDHELFRDTPDYTFMSDQIEWNKETAFEWYIEIPMYTVPRPIQRCDDIMYQTKRMIMNNCDFYMMDTNLVLPGNAEKI